MPTFEEKLSRTIAFLHLACLAGVLHLWNCSDVAFFWALIGCLACSAMTLAIETYVSIATGSWGLRNAVFLLPPLLLTTGVRGRSGEIYVPTVGFRAIDDKLRRAIEHAFQWPMIAVALSILPITALEYAIELKPSATANVLGGWVRSPSMVYVFAVATAMIWFAFAFEFLVMLSVAKSRLGYCRKHWLDLLIILLPLIAFLRALRLGRLLRLQHVARSARIYRVKGLVSRVQRALIVLDVINRIRYRKPEVRLLHLRSIAEQKREELTELELEISELEKRVSEQIEDSDVVMAAANESAD
ncbi:hypothetical protein [Stratiformator vulcanicus]|uniref:Ion transport protein n=1 Tax=Stratiformator vulcanicus TaxID=2527980 RepID=A0A517R2I1_9PLAN|nr:hypothetical protein [Stratiformator vulcanicus]QDT38087.1 hypothetical protein Pan189_24770 [Stratiformator vulcanicus]